MSEEQQSIATAETAPPPVTKPTTKPEFKSFVAKLTPQQVVELAEIVNQAVLTFVQANELPDEALSSYRRALLETENRDIDAELARIKQ